MPETLHATLRDRLQEERDRLHDQLRQMGVGPGGKLDFDDGFADTGQVTAERGEVEALGGTLLETLREIEDALAQVRRRDVRPLRVVRQSDRRGAARGHARSPAVHQLRVQPPLSSIRAT